MLPNPWLKKQMPVMSPSSGQTVWNNQFTPVTSSRPLCSLWDIGRTETIELAGPESLSRKSLILRAAELLDHHPVVINLPLGCGLLLAGVLEAVSRNPPVTRDMLNVLDHDDDTDALSAAGHLGITLTSLDDMLQAVIRAPYLTSD